MRAKWIGRYDSGARMLRLGRLAWERGTVGDGNGYSAKLSFGLRIAMLQWRFDGHRGWMINVAGLRIHYQRSYGGIYA